MPDYSDVPHIELADGSTKKLTAAQLAMVRRGAELTRLMKDYKKELDEINTKLKAQPGSGVSIVLPAEVRVPIADTESISIADADGLKQHLGTRKFNQQVTTSVSYKAKADLLESYETDKALQKFFSVKQTTAVKYLPIKTQK